MPPATCWSSSGSGSQLIVRCRSGYQSPPALVLVGRPQDNWLATWSRADAAVSHPLDPIELGEAVVRLLRSRVPAKA